MDSVPEAPGPEAHGPEASVPDVPDPEAPGADVPEGSSAVPALCCWTQSPADVLFGPGP